jgi:hypothetical protein
MWQRCSAGFARKLQSSRVLAHVASRARLMLHSASSSSARPNSQYDASQFPSGTVRDRKQQTLTPACWACALVPVSVPGCAGARLQTVITASATQHVPAAFGRAPHLLDPSGSVAAWFTEPPGVWLQFVKATRGTDELTEWLAGPALSALLTHFPGQMLTVVLDFRLMTDRDLSARARLLQTAPALKDRVTKVVIIPSLSATPIHVKTMAAGVRLARSFGLPIDLQQSATQVQHLHGLRSLS